MITIVKETITPEVAKEYLATNDGNRRLSMRIAGQLASEIREGRWQLTHQGISERSKLLPQLRGTNGR